MIGVRFIGSWPATRAIAAIGRSKAQRLADERRQRCRRSRKMSNPRMNQYVIRGLQQYWSPDQISGRARRDFPKQPGRQISHQTIYNWIAQQRSEGRDWRKYLRRGGQQLGPSKRGRLVGCVTIEGRPRIVDQRRRFGDWEGDTIVGKGALLTAVERKSGLVRVMKMPNRRADTTCERPARPWVVCHGACFTRSLSIMAKSSLSMRPLPNSSAWRFTSPNRTVPGSAEPMKTPMDCCGSIFPKAPTSPASATKRWLGWSNKLTNVLAAASDTEPQSKFSAIACAAFDC